MSRFLASIVSCALLFAPLAAGAEESLFNRLGGKEAITKVVDQFVSNVLADPSIQPFFAITVNEQGRAAALKKHLVEQICQTTGGPCVYSGRDMRSTHQGMAITNAQFDHVVEALVRALDTMGVPATEKGELLTILGPLRSAIVEKP